MALNSQSNLARPKETEEMRSQAAARIVSDLIKNGVLTEEQRNQAIHEIVTVTRGDTDGYQICKQLDLRYGWDCDSEMVDEMDNFSSYLFSVFSEAERTWASTLNPQPPFTIGTRVSFGLRGDVGEIIDIREPAKYLIKIDGQKDNSCRVVDFEDTKEIS
jgi:hypothetical protein